MPVWSSFFNLLSLTLHTTLMLFAFVVIFSFYDGCECVGECTWHHETFLVHLSLGNRVVKLHAVNKFDVTLLQLAQLIVNAGGVAAVVDYVGECKSNVRLPGIMMLGYVAAHSENLAMAVIVSKVATWFDVQSRFGVELSVAF